jgi:hypothetical protein
MDDDQADGYRYDEDDPGPDPANGHEYNDKESNAHENLQHTTPFGLVILEVAQEDVTYEEQAQEDSDVEPC